MNNKRSRLMSPMSEQQYDETTANRPHTDPEHAPHDVVPATRTSSAPEGQSRHGGGGLSALGTSAKMWSATRHPLRLRTVLSSRFRSRLSSFSDSKCSGTCARRARDVASGSGPGCRGRAGSAANRRCARSAMKPSRGRQLGRPPGPCPRSPPAAVCIAVAALWSRPRMVTCLTGGQRNRP